MIHFHNTVFTLSLGFVLFLSSYFGKIRHFRSYITLFFFSLLEKKQFLNKKQ